MFERIFVHALRSDSQEGQNLTDRFFYATPAGHLPSTNGKTQ